MSDALERIDVNLWHAVHRFRAYGIAVTSRMTVVRLSDGALWLHSPIPLSAALRKQIDALGPVRFVVAPNLYHHLFASQAMQQYPQAELYVAPGLARKRSDLPALRELGGPAQAAWQNDFDEVFVAGVPILSESVWLHRATGTLIATDLLQWTTGDVPLSARLYARFQSVRNALAVPGSLRWSTRDRLAARRSLEAILRWPVKRLVIAHNVILDERDNVASQVRAALDAFIARL
jgi:hypothetical protein